MHGVFAKRKAKWDTARSGYFAANIVQRELIMKSDEEIRDSLRMAIKESSSSSTEFSDEKTLPRHMFDSVDVSERVDGQDTLHCKARIWGYLRHFSEGLPKVRFNPDKLEWELDSKEVRKFKLKRIGTSVEDGVKVYHYYISGEE